MVADPLVGLRSVINILIVVVLPAPFGPKNPNISPFLTEKDTLSTAIKLLYFFVRLLVLIISKVFPPINNKDFLSINYHINIFIKYILELNINN